MNKEDFRKLAENKLLYLDGATGSNLMKQGMPSGVCPEKWILDHPDVLIDLQREYIEAGSNIIYAPTFTANRIKLKEYGLEDQIEEINESLVKLSITAAAGKALVAGDVTMTGCQLAPMGTLDFEELIEVYKEQIMLLDRAGVDLIAVETMMSLQETRAALIAAKEVCDLPVIATLTFEENGRTLYGTDAMTAAITLEKLGAAAVGANCSTGPDKMISLIEQIAEVVEIPVIAKPNAGMPFLNEQGETTYSMEADVFAQEMKALIKAGAGILGGCCGTTPAHIQRLVEETKNCIAQKHYKEGIRYLTSERKTVAFDLESPFMIVGERINPTGKKKLQEQLREGCLDMVISFAEEQEECGAALLDINVGMGGIDEKKVLLQVMDEVLQISNLPLSIDSSHVDVIEEALRRYPGRALINSISGEEEKWRALLPIAEKYGAMFILLPLSDKGLPENLEEKIEIIDRISQTALAMGMKKEDIVVDGLVATVGANPAAAKEVLETIRYCKKNGFATTCGLSNISFGLPERSFVNTAFLAMAIQEGLTMAIANPSQDLLVNIAFASDLLLNKEEGDIRYIERMEAYQERKPVIVSSQAASKTEGHVKSEGKQAALESNISSKAAAEELNGQICQDVLKGNRKQIVEHTKAAVESGEQAQQILNKMLLPAIDKVGELFDQGKYFLPQLIASAETMKLSIEYLEPLLATADQTEDMPVVVAATVAGDIHDIGKNLVILMMKNHGFQVIDLGKDVPREVIVKEAIEKKASLILLSALMTTTMQEMKLVIEYARKQKVTAQIMVGGAVVTPEYAKEIGADGYSADAADAVRVAKQLLGMEGK